MSEPAVSDEALKKAEAYIEEEEGAANRLAGALGLLVTFLAVAMSVFHLYAAYSIVPTQTLRPVHVAFVLALSFLVFPATGRVRDRVMWWDWLMALATVAVVAYMIAGGDDFTDRNTLPNATDIAFGVALMVLLLEAMRRTNGWVMPIVTLAFVAYAFAGPWLPAPECCRKAPKIVNRMISDADTSTAEPKMPSSVMYMWPTSRPPS
jgi:TRAP-type uncharacterized transport system fused permease subunit